MQRRLRLIFIETSIEHIIIFCSELPKRQLDNTWRHLSDAKLEQYDALARFLKQPVAQKIVITRQILFPLDAFKKRVVAHPRHKHAPAVAAARYPFFRQPHTFKVGAQCLHETVAFPDRIVTGLAALYITEITLKSANLFF